MSKPESLVFATGYVLLFVCCSSLLHFAQHNIEVSSATLTMLKIEEWIFAADILLFTIEFKYGLGIKDKIKELVDRSWKKFIQKYF